MIFGRRKKSNPAAPPSGPPSPTPENDEVEFIPQSGACLASKHILSGQGRVQWMVRNPSNAPADNGWLFFSEFDDEAFTANMAENFQIVAFNTMCNIEPALIGIYDFPVGSDLELVRSEEEGIYFVDADTGQRIPKDSYYVPPQFRDQG